MKVLSKQRNSRMCLVCGMENASSVHGMFYNMEDGSVGGLFTFRPEHQSYPGRVHGGMLATMVDELAGRVLWTDRPGEVGVTMDIQMRYRKPVPYNVPLKGRGVYIKKLSRAYSAKCEIMTMDGEVLAEGIAKYLIQPADKILEGTGEQPDWDYYVEDDPPVTEIDF